MSFRRCWTCGAQPASHPGARGPPAGPVNDGHSEDVANLLKRQLPVFHNILFLSCSSAEQVNIIQLGANHVPPRGGEVRQKSGVLAAPGNVRELPRINPAPGKMRSCAMLHNTKNENAPLYHCD